MEFAVGGYILGVVLRVVLPYLQVWITEPQPFNWRMVVGSLIASAIAIIPTLEGVTDQLTTVGFVTALVLGWGAGDIGREAQKFYDRIRN